VGGAITYPEIGFNLDDAPRCISVDKDLA